ncbi:MAG: hypothetical protein J6386_16570 [Candidatus Synoicihabitans palmerolidicus]|nr:hypothetical protein [Candidatus Synoicihabitans palmerolidicus]
MDSWGGAVPRGGDCDVGTDPTGRSVGYGPGDARRSGAPVRAEVETAGYALHLEANFDRSPQRLQVTGTFRSAQALEGRARLSYQL